MKREKITAWSTKYALTGGIEKLHGELRHNSIYDIFSYGAMTSLYGNEWHRTPEAALARAEEMRKARIKSLKNSLAKLKKITFSIPE